MIPYAFTVWARADDRSAWQRVADFCHGARAASRAMAFASWMRDGAQGGQCVVTDYRPEATGP